MNEIKVNVQQIAKYLLDVVLPSARISADEESIALALQTRMLLKAFAAGALGVSPMKAAEEPKVDSPATP